MMTQNFVSQKFTNQSNWPMIDVPFGPLTLIVRLPTKFIPNHTGVCPIKRGFSKRFANQLPAMLP